MACRLDASSSTAAKCTPHGNLWQRIDPRQGYRLVIRDNPTAFDLADRANDYQEIAEATRLGIPIVFTSNPRNHISTNLEFGIIEATGQFSTWPGSLGMAAAHDPAAPAADRLNGADSQWALTIRMLFGLGIRWAQPNSSRAGSAPSAGVHSRTRPPPRPAWRRHWHGVGYVVGAAVAADRQKRGYGAAITSALTRTLLAEFGVCALGIMDHDTRARAVFERVGYRERLARSLIRM